MSQPQHLLVPTDFSSYAECALAYAIALARALHARVTLLHVISAMYWATGELPGALSASVMEELEACPAESGTGPPACACCRAGGGYHGAAWESLCVYR
jgi:hypothetical protein